MSDIDMTRRNPSPRDLTDKEKAKLDEFVDLIHYSARYDPRLTKYTQQDLDMVILAPLLEAITSLQNQNMRSSRLIRSLSNRRYSDDEYEYRHVQLPKNMLKVIPRDYFDGQRGTLKLLWETEWRALGITQSLGWEHYEVHEPEPHILLFKYVDENVTRSVAMD